MSNSVKEADKDIIVKKVAVQDQHIKVATIKFDKADFSTLRKLFTPASAANNASAAKRGSIGDGKSQSANMQSTASMTTLSATGSLSSGDADASPLPRSESQKSKKKG